MSSRDTGLSFVLATALVVAAASPARAQWAGDSTDTLPGGLFGAMVNYVHADTGELTQRGALARDGGGDEGADLLRQLLDPSSDFGSALIRYRASAEVIAPSVFYGVTDWLSAGVVLPVFVSARVDLRELQVGTGAIGYNPDFSGDMERQSPVLSAGDPRALSGAEGVRRVLTDVFEYERLDNWRGRGLGDLQVLGRLRPLATRHLRAAIQPGVQLPTGTADDPDNLVDFGLGSGQVDAGALAMIDLLPAPWLRLDMRAGYTWQLPNHQRARVYEEASIPLAPVDPLPDQYGNLGREREVVRDLGDVWQVGATLRLGRGLIYGGGSWDYWEKTADAFSSDAGPHLAMSLGTAFSVTTYGGHLGVDLVPSFLAGKSPLPVSFDVAVSRSVSDQITSNLTTVLTRVTLYFGPASAAKGAAR